MTRDGCLQQDSLAHCIQKVPAKDGNGCSRSSPSCPLPWSPGIHKSAAGITVWHAESEGPTRIAVTGTSRSTRTAVGRLPSRRSRRSGTRSVSCTASKVGRSVNRGSPRPRSLSATTVACASGSCARGTDQLMRAPHQPLLRLGHGLPGHHGGQRLQPPIAIGDGHPYVSYAQAHDAGQRLLPRPDGHQGARQHSRRKLDCRQRPPRSVTARLEEGSSLESLVLT